MVQIIESRKRPSFSERLNAGVSRGLEMGEQLMQKKQMKAAAEKLGIDPAILQLPKEAQAEYFKNQFAGEKSLSLLQQSQLNLNEEKLKALRGRQELFKKLTGDQQQSSEFNSEASPQQKSSLSQMPESNLSQLAAFAGQPGEEGVIGNMAKSEIDRRFQENKTRNAKQKEYFKFNEPKVAELANTQQKLQVEQARYDRLSELFSDPSKFPSGLTAALFSKEGQINDLAYSQLTPEAQESLKLIIDATSNIKDTYGSRVTNFDIQTYLKKLPSLLNSEEGKQRVLRDLKIINELNRMHASGIQQIFEEEGGTDKIPYSKAETLYKKRFGEIEKNLLDKFVHPEKESFNELPNANKYLGRKIKNPETGEIFISDGKEWKPFKG